MNYAEKQLFPLPRLPISADMISIQSQIQLDAPASSVQAPLKLNGFDASITAEQTARPLSSSPGFGFPDRTLDGGGLSARCCQVQVAILGPYYPSQAIIEDFPPCTNPCWLAGPVGYT